MNSNPLTRKIFLSLLLAISIFSGSFSFFKAIKELTMPSAAVQGVFSTQAIGPVYNKKAYVLIYNPVFSNGQKLTEYMGWNNPDTQVSQYIDWLKVTTNNKVNFTVAQRNEIADFTTFTDGSKYTQETYLACMSNNANCLKDAYGSWLMTDYPAMLNSIGICNLFNAGTIDELWMFGAPYMGWWEANQTGTGAFNTNGPVIYGTSCNKPMNIMGFSYERGLAEMVEDLMHRIEGTMSKAYGSWAQNRMAHNWDKYGLVDYQSPSYTFSGCGSCHYAPNSTADYQWSSSANVSTYCDEFIDYPDPIDTGNRKTINCNAWGCTGLGYFRWWLQRFPSKSGVAPDNKYADWWKYVLEPNSVYDSLTYVPTLSPTPTSTPTPIPFTYTPTATPIANVSISLIPSVSIPGITVSVSPEVNDNEGSNEVSITPTSNEGTSTSITPTPEEYNQTWEILDMLEPVISTFEGNTDNVENLTIEQVEEKIQNRVALSISLFTLSGFSFAAALVIILKLLRPLSF
jgi:hypothetical protein